MNSFTSTIEYVGLTVDGLGVAVTVGGLLYATVRAVGSLRTHDVYARYRRDVGRSILLGLELLVAGDIIRTVAVAPTLQNVAILAVIVMIRTFLSLSLQVELEGRWPWQQKRHDLEQAASTRS